MARFRAGRAAGWSLTWAIGAAIGVALGAYLTVTGAQAAPGDVRLDSTELLVLPAAVAGAVFAVSFIGRALFALFVTKDSHGPGRGEDDPESDQVG